MSSDVESDKYTEFNSTQVEFDSQIDAEINTLVKNLTADQGVIESLMTEVLKQSFSVQQRYGLVQSAYRKLEECRVRCDDLAKLLIDKPQFNQLLSQLVEALGRHNTFSLQEARLLLDQLQEILFEGENEASIHRLIYQIQALISSIKHNYIESASHYASAASLNHSCQLTKWSDLKSQASALFDQGRELNDKAALIEAVELLRSCVFDLIDPEKHSSEYAFTHHLLGCIQGLLGQRQSGTRYLEDAIDSFDKALSHQSQSETPIAWAESLNSLGNALGILGHRLGDEEMLDRAAESFEHALEIRTQWRYAEEWASTLNNLAAILQSRGQQKNDAKFLKRSVNAYTEVLLVWSKETHPIAWASTMSNMATAMRLLGEHRKGARTLEKSIAAYTNCLSIRQQKTQPHEWAMTQNNLGVAFQKLAERVEDIDLLSKAITAYENALLEWTKERVPMTWAMTIANLAVARKRYAEVTDDLKAAKQAVDELEDVSQFFRNASHAPYSELAIDQLAQARKLMNSLNSNQGI